MISKLITIIVVGGFVTASTGMYLLPVLIGWARHVPGLGVIAVIDILLGWTFFGWVVALVLAARPVNPAGPAVQFIQNLPPPLPPPPGQSPDAGWAGPPGPPPARQGPAPQLTLPPKPPGPASPGSAARPSSGHGQPSGASGRPAVPPLTRHVA